MLSMAAAKDLLFIPPNFGQPAIADRHGLAFTIEIPDEAEWECFGFFLQGEAGGVVAGSFGKADGRRFE